MLASAIPAKIQLPFAASGDKVTIPVASQIGVTDGRASFTTGFVPLNATPLSAGGVAPFETDVNGVLFQITAVQQWQCAGGIFRYDVDFSTAIGGYPKYAVLMGSTGIEYFNLVDNNTSNPESLSSVNWVSRLGSYRTARAIAVSSVLDFNDVGARIVASAGAGTQINFTVPDATNLPFGSTITIENLSGFPLGIVQAKPSDRFISAFDTSGTATNYTVPNLSEITLTVFSSALWGIGGTGDFKRANFKSSLSANGWRQLPDGDIEQWGIANAGAAGSPITVTFPIPFPNGCFQIVASQADPAASIINAVAADSPSASTFRLANSGASTITARWRAIGK